MVVLGTVYAPHQVLRVLRPCNQNVFQFPCDPVVQTICNYCEMNSPIHGKENADYAVIMVAISYISWQGHQTWIYSF
jgi:hypothetical protein